MQKTNQDILIRENHFQSQEQNKMSFYHLIVLESRGSLCSIAGCFSHLFLSTPTPSQRGLNENTKENDKMHSLQ